jgi:uncharacterized protein YeaO (DUF488 family)
VRSPHEEKDGKRYYLETLWPEGIGTKDLWPFEWIKELAPSYALNQTALEEDWAPDRFKKEYWAELSSSDKKHLIDRLRQEIKNGTVTFLYAAPSPSVSSVTDLKEYLTQPR